MKTSLLVSGSALALLALRGLAATTVPTPPLTALSGHLAHAPQADSVRLQVGPRRVATVLSSAGEFRLVVAGLTEPQQAKFSYGKERTSLWLSPGDRQHLTVDFPKFDETVQYSGRGAATSNYLARALYRFEYDLPGQVPVPLKHLTPQTTPAEFAQQETAYQQQRQDFLETYAQAHALPKAFVRDQRQILALQAAQDRLSFIGYWPYRHQDDTPAQALVLPATYFDFLPALRLPQLMAHPTAAITPLVTELLGSYTNRLVPNRPLSTDPAALGRLYAVATADLGLTPARDQVIYNLLTSHVLQGFPSVLAAYPTFKAQNRDSTLARELRQQIVARLPFAAGQPAPDFTLRDNTGKEVSMRELRGKVVYLDFWGTWCPPCMNEMTKHSHALKERFLGQDVAFVYISVRDTQAQWQQVLQQEKLTSANSVHLWAPDKSVAQLYQVPYYPCYYLIGRDGRFVEAYTTLPSDGAKTVAAIEAALKAPAATDAQR
jgi:peroxiredoxin